MWWSLRWPSLPAFVWAGLGAAVCVAGLAWISEQSMLPVLMAPFGATLVIVYALPSSPLAQPRNVVLGYVLTAALGLVALQTAQWLELSPQHPLLMAVATGLGVSLMMVLRCVHPPAGANPLLVLMTMPGWHFLFTPVAAGSLFIVLCAWGWHRSHGQAYPVSGWWR